MPRVIQAKKNKEAVSIAYVENIVDLWNAIIEADLKVELGSDQSSLHNPFAGGYYPTKMSFDEANEMMANDPERFKEEVYRTLREHVDAVNQLTGKGMYFFDYGNAFLLEANRAGADILNEKGKI